MILDPLDDQRVIAQAIEPGGRYSNTCKRLFFKALRKWLYSSGIGFAAAAAAPSVHPANNNHHDIISHQYTTPPVHLTWKLNSITIRGVRHHPWMILPRNADLVYRSCISQRVTSTQAATRSSSCANHHHQ